MKVVDVILEGIGGKTGEFDRAWASLSVSIDDGTDHHGSVEISCVIARKPTTTWADMEADTRQQAINYMKCALAALEANDIASLRKNAKDAVERENARLEAAFTS